MFLISLLLLAVYGHQLIYTSGKEKYIREFDSKFQSNEIPAFLKKNIPYFTVELVYNEKHLKRTVKTCLLQNGFNERIEIFTDPFYFNYVTSGDCGFSGDFFNSTVVLKKTEAVPSSATDSKTNQQRAIKKIAQPFTNPTLSKRAFRELMLLAHLQHENIICLKDAFLQNDDLYFVTELLGADLHRLLSVKPLEPQYIKFFCFQMLHGLRYVHQAGVIHRDLKPANILVNENCDLKICDFGLARVSEQVMTGYVSTRYYRAPEIMLTWQHYDKAVDLWSLGCIFGEMLEGKQKPLFPGKDHVDQFTFIAELLGSPPIDVVQSIASENVIYYRDLLSKMLQWDPKKRITAKEALDHPYFDEYKDGEEEELNVVPFDWSFMEQNISTDEWRQRVIHVINNLQLQ
ncbi:MAPK protein hog1 [Boothiomyces sp. JEL0866]|nr:MAPK protein hog1 [Boothiomyces sp. JEL0866]